MLNPTSSSAPTSPVAAEWTQRKERSQRPVLRFMVWLSLLLGRRASRWVLRGIAVYFLLFAPRARAALQGYYQRLWQRRASWSELYRHFFSFASVIHDRVFLLAGQHDQLDVRLEGEDRHALEQFLQQRQGVVILGAHFGSFEVLKALGEQNGQTVYMLMYGENASKLNSILAAINPQASEQVIALNRVDSMLRAREQLAQGHWLGLLADRTFANDETAPHTFLGSTAYLPSGPLRLAAMLGCPVVFLAAAYVGGKRYQVHARVLGDFAHCSRAERAARMQQVQQAFVQQLEEVCRRYPHNWFNFFDFWASPQGVSVDEEQAP